jgi:DNA-binding SARP family transcriptional activator/DNA-binding CsgD family transcriptional regulator
LQVRTVTAIGLCGRLTVEIDGRRLERALPSRQGRLLFAYLVLHRERAVARRELIEALWPERAPASPDALLSSLLSRLRRALPTATLEGRGHLTLQLGPNPWVDVEAATQAAAQAARALDAGAASEALSVARSSLAILAGGFLPGVDSPWVEERRRTLAALEVGQNEVVARAGLAVGGAELVPAETAARNAIERERFRESAYAALMEILAARGNLAEALRVYETVRTLLRDELGTVPSPQLRALSDRLLCAEIGRTPGMTAAGTLTEPAKRHAQRPRSGRLAAPRPVSARTSAPSPAPSVPAPPLPLVGREAECARIDGLIDGARRHRSGALVLSGEPGIGKSALCAWAVSRASGMRGLTVRGVDSEVDLPFAGLSELCAGELDRIDLLPAPQARALEGALARRDAPPGDRFAIGAALLSLLALASEREPLLVVVDDAQWLDAASADALLFAARRLRGDAVALLVATRPGAAFDTAALPRLPLDGLARPAARALLEAEYGGVPGHVAELLAQRTGGNPLALLELPRLLSETQLAGREPIDEPLPVGPTLERALLHRLTGLEAGARRALLVAAASGAERVQPVVDALGALGLDRGVLDGAEQAGVLTIVGERFEFRHPLLRSAIYHGATGPARRTAHDGLARVTSGEARVWHLAHASVGENETVAAMLEQVGQEARRRGAPAAAAAALERAAGLSGPGPGRVRRLTEAARDAHIGGRPARALRLLDDALADSPGAVERADIQHIRGRILVLQGNMGTAYRLLVDEAERIREVDPERTATMLAEACMERFLSGDIPAALSAARDACDAAAKAGLSVEVFARVMLAVALVLAGERAEAGALLDRSLPLLRLADPLTEAGQVVSAAAQCYFWLDRYDIAAELLDGLTKSAREASAPTALVLPLCCRAELDLRVGRWSTAAARFQEAANLGEEIAESVFAAYAPECLARLAGAAGEEARCRDHAARALRLIDKHGNELGRLYVHSALGLLELSLGRIDAAIRHLEPARDLAERSGLAEPNVVHWQADLIEAYVRAGDRVAARHALSALERQAKRTGGHWALGTAARCHGLLADDTQADDHFAAALEHLQSLGDPFEIARTHLCHGERLRRAGRRTGARQALRLAIDGFQPLGVAAWASRAHAELRATGATPSGRPHDSDRDQLTAHELQVALVVARGASNREAAAALFLSPKTIEFHLAHIYRKLGVRTRTELAGVGARRGWLDQATTAAYPHAVDIVGSH